MTPATGQPKVLEALAKPANPLRCNGAQLLLEGHAPGRLALACGDERVDYGELRERVARMAAVWRARGLGTGGRVAIRLDDGPDWVVAWLSAIWAGGVAVGVSPRASDRDWAQALDEAGFELVVTASADGVPAPWVSRVVPIAEARREALSTRAIAPCPVPAQEPAFWVYSSGTSGRAKAVIHAHGTLAQIARISVERLGVTPDSRLFSSSRLFFTYPLVNVMLAGLRTGATVLLDPQWPTAASVAASVARLRPSVLFSVPSLYRDMLRQGLAEAVRDAGVRCCVSAGEALSAALRERWQDATGLPMVDGYGTSETLTLVLTAVPGDDGLRPSPGAEVEALDPEAARQGAPVRLGVRVATLALGYHERAEAQGRNLRDGAFYPADMFMRTARGGWRFAGREDSLLKIRGRWVDLGALEEQLTANLPAVREAAAVGVADADEVDALAFFYVAEDSGLAHRILAERIAALPTYQRPAWLEPIESLPRTATGKLLRRALAERIGRSR